MTQILDVQHLVKRFGGLTAVSDVSFSVAKGEIFGIIGPNGAGKTTLFNAIAGYFPPTAGKVTLDGRDITGRPSDEIARRGIARTFQAVHSFGAQSVRENLRRSDVIGRYHNPLTWFRDRARPSIDAEIEEVAEFVGLSPVLDSTAGEMAYGQQKILGVGMALMVRPQLVLMDEPAAGLNPSEKRQMGNLIRKLRSDRGISVLLVEHDMPLVMGTCDRILVVNQGKPIALGTPDAIKADKAVIDAYLGEDYEFA
ncbi:ABC transporter ATP-binding protein [Paracoccus sp. (in: a-proteobacteria)]|uniref:ABC transporter ATP-binding protein n=1 Tax=Paracoccus sp. TaxID=267 RepID=UPI002AFF0BEF|nr:ABC transporter ATP-binding protein [Paracoccus sp. (in: a-proteobacteria)]